MFMCLDIIQCLKKKQICALKIFIFLLFLKIGNLATVCSCIATAKCSGFPSKSPSHCFTTWQIYTITSSAQPLWALGFETPVIDDVVQALFFTEEERDSEK